MNQPAPSLFHDPLSLLAALWLLLLSAVVLLAPVWIPGDGLVWTPGSKGLSIHRIAQVREVTFAPGQRIVYFNGTPWESTRELHRSTPLFPLQSPRISYEIRDGEWKLRRQVLQAPLPLNDSLTAYWKPAAILLLLTVLSLTPWRRSLGVVSLPAMGSALAVWTVANQSLLSLVWFQFRQLEIAALLFALGLGALLRLFLGPGNRLVDALPWVMVTAVALSWVVMTDRWDWWRSVQWGLAICGAITLASGLYSSARRSPGS